MRVCGVCVRLWCMVCLWGGLGDMREAVGGPRAALSLCPVSRPLGGLPGLPCMSAPLLVGRPCPSPAWPLGPSLGEALAAAGTPQQAGPRVWLLQLCRHGGLHVRPPACSRSSAWAQRVQRALLPAVETQGKGRSQPKAIGEPESVRGRPRRALTLCRPTLSLTRNDGANGPSGPRDAL